MADQIAPTALQPEGPRISFHKRLIVEAKGQLLAISEEKAAFKPGEKWSIKEELGHLIDSATNNHRRLVVAQIEDAPVLPSYDQTGWVNANAYHRRSWNSLVHTWEAANHLLLWVAESAPQDAWARKLTIQGYAEGTLEFIYNDYIDHHLNHLSHLGVDLSYIDESRTGSARNPGHSVEGYESYPDKLAPAARNIPELLARRWSPVAFDKTRPVPREQILILLEAARWAPSCFNEQPWRYLVFDGTDPERLAEARDCLVEGNAWAREASVLLLSVAHEDFALNGKPNRHAQHDTGMASENLALAASDLGLAAHQMAGFDAERSRRSFAIPERFTPMAMIALGYAYRGDLMNLAEKARAREQGPRKRNPSENFAFAGSWGKVY